MCMYILCICACAHTYVHTCRCAPHMETHCKELPCLVGGLASTRSDGEAGSAGDLGGVAIPMQRLLLASSLLFPGLI